MSMVEYDTRSEAQEAFLTLLTRPLLSVHTDPTAVRSVLAHRSRLDEWVARLGYRLVIAPGMVRLHRDPAGPQRTAAPPAWNPPPRRVLVLQALAAAACESVGTATTVQDLSDETRLLSVGPGASVSPYDPDRRVERRAFLKALERLVELGVLVRRTSDDSLLRLWEEEGTGMGAGYEVDPETLLQLTDPYTVELAFAEAGGLDDNGRTATRGQRMLRTLVEDLALLYADLHPADAEYARGQRGRLAAQAVEMTGGMMEIRAEGMLLRLPEDSAAALSAMAPFPAPTAPSWFALKALETAVKLGPDPDPAGRVQLPADTVDSVASHLHTAYAGALTDALASSPAQLRSAMEQVLTGLGLVRVGPDRSWTIPPVAGRYRDPQATWEPTLADAMLEENR